MFTDNYDLSFCFWVFEKRLTQKNCFLFCKKYGLFNSFYFFNNQENFTVLLSKLSWSSYLSARKQYVSVNGHISDHLNISCCVLQGSVLGPLLFLLYINDLPNVSKLLTFYLFADDTNIYLSSLDLIKLQKTMNRELRKIRKWLAANRLALNIDKTNYFSFS